jgi:hypothetical protein|tara:strand:- start:20018 stop:20470 length:453 start_codon:yes stop_codon:yes gene_type:complete
MANDLNTTITDAVTLNGSVRGSTVTTTQSGIIDVFERIVTCTQGQETTIARFAASPYTDPVAIDVDRTKYIRVTNLSATENIEVAFVGSATLYQVKLRPGYSHVLSEGAQIFLAEADVSPSFGTMESLSSIIVKPVDTTDVQTEIFVALV